uniref:Retrotransposon gag domain-containing protein n=1 Tax=Manihot esculenta TaxID=3983 RepID=A0A2C9U239_MANES
MQPSKIGTGTFIELPVLEKIFHAKTTKVAWNILLKTYEGVDLVKITRLHGLKRQYELMEQEKDESIRDYFSRMQKIVNEMKNNGDKIEEKDVKKIMRTLLSWFDYMVTVIKESKDLEVLTLNDLQASLESQEMWMNERSPSTLEQALKSK